MFDKLVISIGEYAVGFCYDEDYDEQKSSGFVIYGNRDTEAYKYASSNGFTYRLFSGEEILTDISQASVVLGMDSYIYDGTPKTPSVTVALDGKTLSMETDYTVEYDNNIDVGTADVTVRGTGNYFGRKTVSFKIIKGSGQPSQPVQHGQQPGTPTAQPDSTIICKKTEYKVAFGAKPFRLQALSQQPLSYTNSKPKIASVNKNTGKVTIKGTGIAVITIRSGNDTVTVTVKVSPKKPKVKSVKAVKGGKFTIKWAGDKMASGYQVQVSAAKNFKKAVKTKNVTKKQYTFTGLKAGKKYYVRLRSYKKSGKETIYGSWSKAKQGGVIKK